MGPVGLLYVGAVLFVDGLMLLGRVDAKAAAPLNLFVGALQVLTPTYLIMTSGGDPDTIIFASGLYLFGFTYLYLGINLLAGLDGSGMGYFALFVAACAVVYAGLNFVRFEDNGLGVLWLHWAFLWGLFFAVLGLGRGDLARYTGAVTAVQGIATAVVPAFLLMTGHWVETRDTLAVVLAVGAVVVYGGLYPRLRGTAAAAPAQERVGAGR